MFEARKESPSPYINHFISADTIVPGYANPQNLNRYSYVTNNPLRYTDPSGHSPCEEYQGVCLSENQMTNIWNNTTGNGNNNDDEDEEEEAQQRLEFCLQHMFAPECKTPEEDIISGIQPDFDFIAPWEINHFDAWGFVLNGTGCFIFVCGDISLNLIGNPTTGENTLFVTPGIHGGLGYGVDGSAGLVAAYDAPYNSSLAEASQNASLNITPGGQGTYSVSESSNVTGNYAQTYSLSASAGGEASAVYGPSYSIPIFTCTWNDCYWGVK